MPKATRLHDLCTGHDACKGVPLVTGSKNVFINRLPAGRKTDQYESHGCDTHSAHNDEIKGGSSTVRINRLPSAREGDSVSIGGQAAAGSPNVRIGG